MKAYHAVLFYFSILDKSADHMGFSPFRKHWHSVKSLNRQRPSQCLHSRQQHKLILCMDRHNMVYITQAINTSLYFVNQEKQMELELFVLLLAAAPPLCLSPSSASLRTTTSTDASSVLCCLLGPPSIWMALRSTRPWRPSLSPKWIIMSSTLDRSSQSGKACCQ